ncbi:hypothetical protein I552_4600 [Mycobacterium xenopi 3993]|nr:hypothetical protein I552_4600 [Mycobacterium xenopi 3993]
MGKAGLPPRDHVGRQAARDVIGTAQQAADFCRAGLLQVPSELRPDQRAFLMGCAEVLGGLAESHGIKW